MYYSKTIGYDKPHQTQHKSGFLKWFQDKEDPVLLSSDGFKYLVGDKSSYFLKSDTKNIPQRVIFYVKNHHE